MRIIKLELSEPELDRIIKALEYADAREHEIAISLSCSRHERVLPIKAYGVLADVLREKAKLPTFK